MLDLLAKLLALYGTLKNLHYSASGAAFYSLHTQADEMNDGILDFIDEIQENYNLGQGQPYYNFATIAEFSSQFVVDGDVGACLRGVLGLVSSILEEMVELKTDAVEDIFSRLNNKLFKINGFVLKTLA